MGYIPRKKIPISKHCKCLGEGCKDLIISWYYRLDCVPLPHSYVKVLTPSTWKGDLLWKLSCCWCGRWAHAGVVRTCNPVSLASSYEGEKSGHTATHRRRPCERQGEGSYMPRWIFSSEPSAGTTLAKTLILDFWSPELRHITFRCWITFCYPVCDVLL